MVIKEVSKLLFVDTETGGLNPNEHSLLSIGLVAWENREIIDSEEIFILDTVIKFTPESYKIHQIDFNDFISLALKKNDAIQKMENFILKNFLNEKPVTVAGHNINFDISFLKVFLGQSYFQYFSHRSIDTASILKYLFMAEILTEDLSASDNAFDYFKIDIKRRHSALEDSRATAHLYNNLLNLLKK